MRPHTAVLPSRPEADTKPPAVRAGKRRRRVIEGLCFIALVVPNFAFVIVFGYWPVIYNGILSFFQWNMISPTKEFVGFANYTELFASPAFRSSAIRTGVFGAAVLAGSVILGLALAVLFTRRLRGGAFVRGMSFLPYVIGGAAVAMMWLFVFDPSYGLIAPVLGVFGIGSPNWLADPDWAMPAIIIVYIWRNAGFAAAIFYAGLQNIPKNLYEAVEIDGAGPWVKFRAITIPMLSPIIYFVLLITFIQSFQAFDMIAILTGGGPGGATSLLSWIVYEDAFLQNQAGAAGAVATIMFVILAGLTLGQTLLMRRWVHYS